jgi:uncharacterized protein
MKRLMPVFALALLAACSQGPGGNSAIAQSAAVHAVSGLPVISLTITHAGAPHRFRVEVAKTGEQQERGLMFRTAMGADEGMIFPMEPPRHASFWMRNTVIALDLLFIGSDGRITNVAANAVPYDETPLPSTGLAKAVLELNGGRAAALGIAPGDLVTWSAN